MLPSHLPDRCRVCGSRDTHIYNVVWLNVEIWVHMQCGSCDATWTAFYEFDRVVRHTTITDKETT